ncbi:MAG: hypothetical protein IJF71_03685 [Clostridia bacterium]|nr:hypothetical protein [Clostridia bacterium]
MNEYFQLIDQAIYLHRSRKPDYDRAVVGLTKGFRKLLEPQREMVNNIVYRIKQDLSLKEKILRRQWYRGVSLPSQILDNIYDCLGIMIECRFMSEEEEVFRAIRSAFTVQAEDGFFECEKLKGIHLDLSRPQPCIQKNGLPNYRIDGRYYFEDKVVYFELQIRSLINSFWSNIEHSVVYKNNVFISDNNEYGVEMLSAIRNNLMGIDTMLQIVKKQIEEQSLPMGERMSIQDLCGKLFSDAISRKLDKEIGVVTKTKHVSKLLANSLVYFAQERNNVDVLVPMIAVKLEQIQSPDVKLTEPITLFAKNKEQERTVGLLQSVVNEDFEWHLFFVLYAVLSEQIDADFSGFYRLIGVVMNEKDYTDFTVKRVASRVEQLLLEEN